MFTYFNGAMSSKPRVSLVHSISTRNVSLRLEALREEDSGTYRCSVNVKDGGSTDIGHDSKSIELKVLGEYEGHVSGPFPPQHKGGQRGLPLKWLSTRPGDEMWNYKRDWGRGTRGVLKVRIVTYLPFSSSSSSSIL